MSVPVHRAPRAHGSRRWRAASALLAIAALSLATAGIAMADDVSVDSDVFHPGVQHSVDITKAPGAAVSVTAQMDVGRQGSKHLAGGTPITVSLDATPTTYGGVSGVTVGDATGTVPAGWGIGSPDFTLNSLVTFNAPTIPGNYQLVIHYLASEFTCLPGNDGCINGGTGDPFIINLTVQAPTPTNTAPVVAFTNAPTTANEGDTKTFSFSITDPDATDTQSFAAGYPNCGVSAVGGHDNTLVGTPTLTNTGGSFSCKFVDGLQTAIANTVSVEVNDGTANSNLATTGVTVSNLAPVVAVPAFSITTVNCQVQVSLGNVSFTDAGIYDATWNGDIDWGDGSTHSTFAATAQGLVTPSPTHTYTSGGTFAATVTVTDKDHLSGSNTTASGSSITVIQYKTDFLPPFDDSSPSGLIVNQMKSGRVVPVKASIYDYCAQAYVTSPAAVTINLQKVATPTTAPNPDPVESYADAGASSSNTNLFRWTTDSTAPGGGFWIYNLDSKALALVVGQYYRIDIKVNGVLATGTDWAILQPVK
ncbi:MAG: PKD domain-containing protein [Propionibacteriales bacterium]|nr:PKD domain-containing protein [Propionibacteriales bacterium]